MNAPAHEPTRRGPEPRAAYAAWRSITTRWMDNDVYGHVNNVVYYSFFDTAVNGLLMDAGVLDLHQGEVVGLVVQTQCDYFAPIAFPQPVAAGVRVARLGRSSVRYEIGLYAGDAPECAAAGHFVHVYVDRATRRPVPLPEPLKAVLQSWKVDQDTPTEQR
ncbi:MAG: acyl-CoA thioesterase [Burkholderiales bacterium]|nr:acyl-CoA thioesterase [Burkholderiales bacterium]